MSNPNAQTKSDIYDFLRPITDTRTNASYWQFDTPHSQTAAYKDDLTSFRKLGSKRNALIRDSHAEFEPTAGAERRTYRPLWVAVVRIAPGWHIKLPLWRGPANFIREQETDAEVADIVATCCALGGYDECNLGLHRSNWAAIDAGPAR